MGPMIDTTLNGIYSVTNLICLAHLPFLEILFVILYIYNIAITITY